MSVVRAPSSDRLESALARHAQADGARAAVLDAVSGATSYGELDRRATRMCQVLQQAGVRAGDRVAVWLPKCTNTLAIILGTLRLGAAYVPIDPQAPAVRVMRMLEDCAASAICVDLERSAMLTSEFRASLPAAWLAVERIDASDALDQLPWRDDASVACSAPTDLDATAYILYTSGTTGMPKGVVVSQRAAMAFVQWAVDTFALTGDDRLASHAPLHFDLSVLDIFAALSAGASVVLFDDEQARNPRALVQAIEAHGITTWYSTPSALMALDRFGQLERHSARTLTRVLFAGEVFPIRALRHLMTQWPQASFANLFGPTETNVCVWYPVPAALADPANDWTRLPIGTPCRHVHVRITSLDDPSREVSSGETLGELEVSGDGVMTAYWQRPDDTARAFTVDADGVRWYRTGDVVRQRPDGLIEFHGRRDRMVKRRGYRMELGDLEAAFAQHPLVSHVAAVVVATEDGPHIHVHCAVPAGDCSVLELRRFGTTLLPTYMLPDHITIAATLPMTSTGKIDYRAVTAASLSPSRLSQ